MSEPLRRHGTPDVFGESDQTLRNRRLSAQPNDTLRFPPFAMQEMGTDPAGSLPVSYPYQRWLDKRVERAEAANFPSSYRRENLAHRMLGEVARRFEVPEPFREEPQITGSLQKTFETVIEPKNRASKGGGGASDSKRGRKGR